MHIIGSILMGIFIAILIFSVLSFSVAMLVVFGFIMLGMVLSVHVKRIWRRYMFVHRAKEKERAANIIEADYKDITDRNKNS